MLWIEKLEVENLILVGWKKCINQLNERKRKLESKVSVAEDLTIDSGLNLANQIMRYLQF